MPRRVLTIILILAVALAALILAPIEFAAAQRGPAPAFGGGGFFNFLFPPTQPAPRVTAPPPRRAAPAQPAAPTASAAAPVAKDAAARKIMVIGDFVGTVLAAGLDQAFAGTSGVRVIDRTNSNSGFARQDYYDWNHALPGILAADHPDVVVMAIGSNDRQQMTGSSTAQWSTPDWDSAYADRATALAAVLAGNGAPFFWLSTLPMRSTPEADMAHLNDLFETPVTSAGGHFVSVWDGFADDNGHLVISGPDVNGQTAQLRTGNGINFTDAGQAKLAFYVQREIRRVTGIDTGGPDLTATLGQPSTVPSGPGAATRSIGPVISLSDPLPNSATTLLGAGGGAGVAAAPLLAAPKDARSPQALLIGGQGLPPVSGRADDFSWPRAAPPGAAVVSDK